MSTKKKKDESLDVMYDLGYQAGYGTGYTEGYNEGLEDFNLLNESNIYNKALDDIRSELTNRTIDSNESLLSLLESLQKI